MSKKVAKFIFRRIRGRIVPIRNVGSDNTIKVLKKFEQRAKDSIKKLNEVAKGKDLPPYVKSSITKANKHKLDREFRWIKGVTHQYRNTGLFGPNRVGAKSTLKSWQKLKVDSLLNLRKLIKKVEKL